jgi:thiol:disulfide interchange protein DsbD
MKSTTPAWLRSAVISLSLATLSWTADLPAQVSFGSSALSGTAEKLSVTTQLAQTAALRGSSTRAAVIVTIAPTWHINAHIPSEDYLIGTSFSLETREGFILADLRYPEGESIKFAFSDKPLDVYEGTFVIFMTIRISENISQGEHLLKGSLEAQACNDQVCLAPSTIELEIPVTVTWDTDAVSPKAGEVFSSYDDAQSVSMANGDYDLAQIFETEGSLTAFLAIFLVGLALNLTPCVYPMLSVTVSLFGTQTETRTFRVFLKAVVYVLGIASMYSVLGVTAALSGGLFGSWLQSPWVLGFISLLLLGLSLSMFGLFQIQVPYWLTSKLGGSTGTGVVSLFVSGLVVGVFAAPCIGPPVIALLALVGSKGDPVFGFWAFFILSLGLGLPYLILGTFSGLLKKIPRSGDWLIWVERIFGVILAAAGLFYLALAVAPKLAAYVPAAALILGGLYLGFLEPSGKTKKVLRSVKIVFGIAALAVGIMFANALREPGISWEPYDGSRLEQAASEGRPVVMDFYADWCIPCLELDRSTFTDDVVIEATGQFVRLKVDLTHFDSPEAENLRKQFSIAGVPTIVFLGPDGEEVPGTRVVGYLPPDEFLERIRIVGEASE